MSSIDLNQFLQTFFEESFEGLDMMESVLLGLDVDHADNEAINTIFRAAHSIKGGSGTFGLNEVISFTHVVETLLDRIRDGDLRITREITDHLLHSVDCLRDMLKALQSKHDFDQDRVSQVQKNLESILFSGDSIAGTGQAIPGTAHLSPEAALSGWKIGFKPHRHLLRTANDPLRLFRELAELGNLDITADAGQLPAHDSFDPEDIYLSWELTLCGDVSRDRIEEIFAWVEDDCELVLQPIHDTPSSAANTVTNAGASQPSSSKEPDQPTERSAAPGKERSETTGRAAGSSADTGSIRVSIDKVDTLVNMVGELVITQSMLSQLGENLDLGNIEKLQHGLAQLERNTRELQENVMRIRMLPISFVFNRFSRLAHDLGQKLGKSVTLKMSGKETELDKTVLEKIGDPLVHLVRNAMDHGIERPDVRLAAGKPETGTVHLNAYHQGGNIVIEIKDDGAGLNRERILSKARERGLVAGDENVPDERIHELLFHPGFSTAETVSDVSGRGVGMDVVRRNIRELGGNVDVVSEYGKGSTFTIRLPLTLAILDGQLIRVGDQIYIIPLVSIIESLQIAGDKVNSIAGKAELYRLRNDYLPIIRLYDVFGTTPDTTTLAGGLLVVVEGDGQKAGLFIDDLLSQQQVVIKSLETNFKRVEGVSGATILGDGTVALILDIPDLIRFSHSNARPPRGRAVTSHVQVTSAGNGVAA